MGIVDKGRALHSSDCDIRYAVQGDVAVLVDLAASTLRETYSSSHDPDQVEQHIASNVSQFKIQEEIEVATVRTLVAFVTGQPVGYATLRVEAAPPCVRAQLPIELARLYLRKKDIGKGRGSHLMQSCIDEGVKLGRDMIWLSVWNGNDRAVRFYEKWNFRCVGTHRFIFGGKPYEDFVMVRPIGDQQAILRGAGVRS